MLWYAVVFVAVCCGMLWYAVVCCSMLWYAVVCGGMLWYVQKSVTPFGNTFHFLAGKKTKYLYHKL